MIFDQGTTHGGLAVYDMNSEQAIKQASKDGMALIHSFINFFNFYYIYVLACVSIGQVARQVSCI